MTVLLIVSLLVVLYAYAGYPLLLFVVSRFVHKTVLRRKISPSVTIVLAVHNEQEVLATKLNNLRDLIYPRDRIEIVVVSDGSSDDTPDILRHHANERLHLIELLTRRGKSFALNVAVREAQGELIVFTDARQRIESGALSKLVEAFADATVGCVSGELMLERPSSAAGTGLGLYWSLEKKIRYMESCIGSSVGATGAFYAARRELVPELPAGTLLDDVFIPLVIARRGYRVLFQPAAVAWDRACADSKLEFRRKVRTLTGNYQLVRFMPWLLAPTSLLSFQFVSHKLLRLVVPFALTTLFISSALIQQTWSHLLLMLQVAGYVFAATTFLIRRWGPLTKLGDVARAFVLLNAAAIVAAFNLFRRNEKVWIR